MRLFKNFLLENKEAREQKSKRKHCKHKVWNSLRVQALCCTHTHTHTVPSYTARSQPVYPSPCIYFTFYPYSLKDVGQLCLMRLKLPSVKLMFK